MDLGFSMIFYQKRPGTSFYSIALIQRSVLLNPAKLARSMIDVLPYNVELYENSCLINWSSFKDYIFCNFHNGTISTKK